METIRMRKTTFSPKHLIIFVFFVLALFSMRLYAQESEVFTFKGENVSKIPLNSFFDKSSQISPFQGAGLISGLAISGDITLNSDSSLIRVILIDAAYKEYLVYETFPLLAGTKKFSITSIAEETINLKNVSPFRIRFEIVDASILLKEISIGKENDLAISYKSQILQQNSEKIKKINENIRNSGQKWLAGETYLSKMSFEKKKAFFGGTIPNLQGLEYYIDGIFMFPDRKRDVKESITVVPDFDWRNRHGANNPSSPYYNSHPGSAGWMTPAKLQGGCNAGYIFAPLAAIEAKVNLYFNRHIDLDLSERYFLSCHSAGNGCSGGDTGFTYDVIQKYGIINESCFPYVDSVTDCSGMCANPEEKISIGIVYYYYGDDEDSKRLQLIKTGPLGAEIASIPVTLTGWGTIKENDTIYNGDSLLSNPAIIRPGDELIGNTYWICKNSLGLGPNGYIKAIGNAKACVADNTIKSLKYTDSDIACNDFDGDGYYYWGIGNKPSYCPPSPDEPDGDDSNPCLGPLNSRGNYIYKTATPSIHDTAIYIGQPQKITALGTDIKWYSDPDLTNLIYSGDTLTTNFSEIGNYPFYVTQTKDGCTSERGSASIIIKPVPTQEHHLKACVGKPVEILVEGDYIKWYEATENPLERIYDTLDGEIYETVKYGHPSGLYQIWTNRNMNHYTPTGSAYYEFDSAKYASTYGRLYNAQGASDVCPEGWNIPGGFDFIVRYHGYEWNAGYNMKEAGFEHWKSTGSPGGNCCGFTALPAGMIKDSVSFGLGEKTEFRGSNGSLLINSSDTAQYALPDPELYQSVRCMKWGDEAVFNSPPVSTGNTYKRSFKAPGLFKVFYTEGFYGGPSNIKDTFFITVSESLPPKGYGDTVVYGQPLPSLRADGENIRWYSNKQLTNMVGTSNQFQPLSAKIGKNTYYATQTIECEGPAISVDLIVKPLPPEAENVTVCENDTVPILTATGTNIKWYDDPLNPITEITDSRDGQKYSVSKLGDQVWMTQNLNYSTPHGSAYYDYDSVKYSSYGRLYNNATAENACPAGWDVPIFTDWEKFSADNKSFKVLFAGTMDNGYSSGFGKEAWFWGSTIRIPEWASYVMMTDSTRKYGQTWVDKFMSVRCIKLRSSEFRGSGDTLKPNVSAPGIYTFYVTQTVDGVESAFDTVTLTINDRPLPPVGVDKTSVYGKPVPSLIAQGENIRWYKDSELTTLLGTGNNYKPADRKPGRYYYFATQTILCESKPDSVSLTIQPFAPVTISLTGCKSSIIEKLSSLDSTIKWYSDVDLNNIISQGIEYINNIVPGVYTFYFTYTYNGIESNPVTVKLTITPSPEIPVAGNISVCEGAVVPDLTAAGTGIKWYADSTLTTLLHKGNSYATGKTQPGNYRYYVTQSVSDCQSTAKVVDLVIHKSPQVYLGKDTSILAGSSLTLSAGNSFQSYEWFNGSAQPSISLSGSQLGMGQYSVWLKVSDTLGCSASDTILVTVMVQTMVGSEGELHDVIMYPNPNNGTLYIKFLSNSNSRVKIFVLDQSGKVLLQYTKEHMEANEVYTVDLSPLSNGTYIIRVTDDEISKFEKIIKVD